MTARALLPAWSTMPCTPDSGVSVRCGLPALAHVLDQHLSPLIPSSTVLNAVLVVDAPFGFALDYLVTAPPTMATIILTSNRCPEYWEDVWDAGPAALIVADHVAPLLPHAFTQLAAGAPFRHTPRPCSSLSVVERTMLRLVAHGWSDQAIATHLCLQHKTVRNRLSVIYAKLGIHNRVEAVLYYWDRQAHPPAPNGVCREQS